jgi:hypothetical protein
VIDTQVHIYWRHINIFKNWSNFVTRDTCENAAAAADVDDKIIVVVQFDYFALW